MPKIPDVANLQTPSFGGTAPVASVNVAQTGRGLRAIGSAIESHAKRKSAYETSKAETDFLENYTREINSYNERNDYGNFENDFQKNTQEFLSSAADRISDPRKREEFINRNNLKIVQGNERIRDMAFGKERDFERSTVVEDLKRLENIGLNASNEDLPEVLENFETRLNTAVEMGYYNQEEKAKLAQAWREDVATSRIAALPADQREEALKQSWANNISIANQAKLKREAREELIESKAIDTVDEYINSGLDRTEVFEKTSQIENDTLRRAVESRFDYQYNKQRQAHNEQQQSFYNEYGESLMRGEITVDQIPRDDWESMDFAVKQNLYKLQQDSVKPRTNSDPDALINLSLMNAKKDYDGIVKYIRENSNLLSDKDKVKYAQIAIDGSMPVEVDDDLTDVQLISGKLAEAEITDKNAKSLILNKVGEWRRNYIMRNNKSPDDNERAKFIDSMFLEVTTSPGLLWDTEKRLYDIGDDEWERSVEVMREEDPVSLNSVIKYFESKNYEPTRGELVETYRSLRERRQGE